MTPALLVLAAALALGGLYALHRRWGLAGALAGAVALLGLVASVLGQRRPPRGPPPPPPSDRVRRTAGDLMHRVATAEREKIAEASDDPDDLARELGRQR